MICQASFGGPEGQKKSISWMISEFATQFLNPVEIRVMPKMFFAGR
jgi:hypothetical protein